MVSLWLLLLAMGATGPAAAHREGHQCIHDSLQRTIHLDEQGQRRELSNRSPQQYGTVADHRGRKLQSTTYSPIRIFVDTTYLTPNVDQMACWTASGTVPLTLGVSSTDTYSCTAADVLTAANSAYVTQTLIPAALAFLQSTYSVIPVAGNLVVSNPLPTSSCYQSGTFYNRLVCCSDAWPSRYKTTGQPNADYILVLTTRPTTGNLLAWATECASDQHSRPIAGQANLSPARLSADPGQFQYQLAVLLHEIHHALGFNFFKLNYFLQPGTFTTAPLSSTLYQGTDPVLLKPVKKVITPKVVAAAKAQYGCYSWANAGLELEDGGGPGTVNSHWCVPGYVCVLREPAPLHPLTSPPPPLPPAQGEAAGDVRAHEWRLGAGYVQERTDHGLYGGQRLVFGQLRFGRALAVGQRRGLLVRDAALQRLVQPLLLQHIPAAGLHN